MEFISLLLATLFVAPPVLPEPDAEPGMGRDAYGDALPFGAVARYGTLRYRAGFAGGVAFSRDGKRVISGGADNDLHFWETDTGKLVHRFEAFSSYNHTFARSPDGKQVVTGNWNEKDVVLRDSSTGKVVRRLKGLDNFPGVLRFSPDGKWVAAAASQTGGVVIWDQQTGKVITRLQMGIFGGRWQQSVTTLAFSQDGKYIALGDGNLLILEVKGWKHVATLEGHSDHIYSIAFTPDNTKMITCAVDWTLRVWDLASRKEIRRVTNDTSGCVTVTRDGKTAIGNDKTGTLTAWNLETGKTIYRGSAKIPANGFTLSDDETRVAGWSWSAVVVYDARTGKCFTPMPVPAYPPGLIAFSPNGKFLALAYGSPGSQDVRLWGFQSGLVFPQPAVGIKYPGGIHVNNDREVFRYASSPKGGLEVWNLTSKKRTAALSTGGYCSSAVFAKDGRVYAAGRDLIEWDTSANRIERRISLPDRMANPVLLLSADERVLLTCRDGEAKSWSAVTGKQLSHMVIHRHDHAVAISPDGQRFVTADQTACLRNTRNGTIVHDFGGKRASAASFSPDGRLIAVADDTGAIQLWDAKEMKRLCRLEAHRDVLRHLLFSPDSRYLASVSNDTTVLIWDVRKVAPGGK